MIGIQGQVDFKRRDYNLVVEVSEKLKEGGIKNIKFNIIGTHNRETLRDIVSEKGLQSYFVFHESLDDRQFFEEVAKCDYLMPLLGEEQKSYYANKMTATYSHSAAYRIPMIIYSANAEAWGINHAQAVLYSDINSLFGVLKSLRDYADLQVKYAQLIDEKVARNKQFLCDLSSSLGFRK